MRRILTAFALMLVLTAATTEAQTPTPDVPLLVSTTWLGDHHKDPRVVVIWTGQAEPDPVQIAGARVVPHPSVMTMDGGQHDLAAPNVLVAALEGAGVSNDSHVVVYGEPQSAGWLFFALDYLGHERTSMLDGGLDKWRSEGRPVAPITTAPARGVFTPNLRATTKATVADVQAALGTGTTVLIDARTRKEYDAGRIPGAKLITWQDVYADPKRQVFKTREEIAALLAGAGVTGASRVIAYCQIGLRSSVMYFAARYAGVPSSNYVGSWSEWATRGLPSEAAGQR